MFCKKNVWSQNIFSTLQWMIVVPLYRNLLICFCLWWLFYTSFNEKIYLGMFNLSFKFWKSLYLDIITGSDITVKHTQYKYTYYTCNTYSLYTLAWYQIKCLPSHTVYWHSPIQMTFSRTKKYIYTDNFENGDGLQIWCSELHYIHRFKLV
jgi:hypothetical protein